ncbi:biotin--[acetyl-CoA-carboxylase] ligase [Salinibacterium sp. UTAS2018]|uniref:biotin--[acetyl-CoA-carboxylase] ligase n=1 Tax=unclassified Salinibacterium TaxID=2632331 RepID=UPI0010095F34|nr:MULTISPECIES: biotin--[acetyl-CoA-carboxylase] ligase [unclassified Salinibacterium]MBH0008723.1 biotin--[acetyl-CoA-carboxylase] ligase [Salinibacterium sp. SWN1162]QAV70003.1 biotin--[acetyl-CoA-carboxylase] ligase [Salinibacterium sp. UTAS2018]
MDLPLSTAVVPLLEQIDEVGSTNQELLARAARGETRHLAALVTANQTAGRGRLGREWVAPAGKTFAVSVLVAPPHASVEALSWMPLIGGLAMARAVRALVSDRAVTLKWPNDVQIEGLKVSGLLSELVAGGTGVIVGAGLNLTIERDELPTSVSTSLLLEGVQPEFDDALSRYLTELVALVDQFVAGGLDAVRSGIADAVRAECGTIGRRVRVELPGGKRIFGTAETVDDQGQLVVRDDANGSLQHVAAGDVTHLRYE